LFFRVDEAKVHRDRDVAGGSRHLLQWLQPGQPGGVKRAEESSYIRFGKRNSKLALKEEAMEEVIQFKTS